MQEFRGTTICAVKKDGKIAIAGDGQVTMQNSVIFKGNAKKVRRILMIRLLLVSRAAWPMLFRLPNALRRCLTNIQAT